MVGTWQFVCAACGGTALGSRRRSDGSVLWPEGWWRLIPDGYACGLVCRDAMNRRRDERRLEDARCSAWCAGTIAAWTNRNAFHVLAEATPV